ncbi:hypothetical protein BD309DRAFT_993087 [Dichomitus squalens]|uniref:Uncharacterized protein n=1 Tax=Dichomitus squalens TaxID=114155 RepID=A0A4Q9NGY0_9APHY|nr:uncharacterized protein DICSQDRAFT_126374 [Dichomitus squalens LYAD-421 SS1]EJF62662.1 hypothetical protein DICSQDRAFT_126374 [Dichomitus squalens LYAD-421 SS1]TBU40409.1 hypothetical protein BD309DRAFT_993087 [Dichomitus squalens]TBU52231.1 hypothetical protein BD310DRAFT_952828 [Dichomitus squalens]
MLQEVIRAFYMCGLEEAAAADAARAVGMPPRSINLGSIDFDDPSWALYRYWLFQDHSFRHAQSGTQLREQLQRLGFRPEVLPLTSTFGETFIPHLDVRDWARRLAADVHRRTSSIPPMPPARL